MAQVTHLVAAKRLLLQPTNGPYLTEDYPYANDVTISIDIYFIRDET